MQNLSAIVNSQIVLHGKGSRKTILTILLIMDYFIWNDKLINDAAIEEVWIKLNIGYTIILHRKITAPICQVSVPITY